jgi:hypothetical protein
MMTVISVLLLGMCSSLYGAGTLQEQKTEFEIYGIDIAAVQEIRCREAECWIQELHTDVQW